MFHGYNFFPEIKSRFLRKPNLKNIQVLIWDVDGTLYRNDNLANEIYNSFIQIVAHHLEIDFNTAKKIFQKQKYSRKTWGQKTEKITGLKEKDVLYVIEKQVDKSDFLEKDNKLIALFKDKKIQKFKHYILTNSSRHQTDKVLTALGLIPEVLNFEEKFTLESFKQIKPHRSCFEKILSHSGLAPGSHLMIGDELVVDIIPAKKMGIKTCHVYSSKKSKYADIHLKDIESFSQIL